MTTITVNKRTKAGKTLLELAKILAENSKGVVIEDTEGSPYNPEFVKKIQQGDEDLKKGKGRTVTLEELDGLWK